MAFLNNRAKDKVYRIYITDALKTIAENTAHIRGGGTILSMRYIEMITSQGPEEERTEEDVINNLKDKLRIIK